MLLLLGHGAGAGAVVWVRCLRCLSCLPRCGPSGSCLVFPGLPSWRGVAFVPPAPAACRPTSVAVVMLTPLDTKNTAAHYDVTLHQRVPIRPYLGGSKFTSSHHTQVAV